MNVKTTKIQGFDPICSGGGILSNDEAKFSGRDTNIHIKTSVWLPFLPVNIA